MKADEASTVPTLRPYKAEIVFKCVLLTKSMGLRDVIVRIVTGKAERKTVSLYLAAVLGIIAVCFSAAQSVFPGGYSILRYYISDQGSWAGNPTGWPFFTIGVCTASVLLYPYFLGFYRRLGVPRPLLIIWLAFISIGTVGFFAVGVFPNDLKPIHDIAADMAFGGYGMAAFLYMIFLAPYHFITGTGKINPVAYSVTFLLLIVEVVFMFLMHNSHVIQWTGFFTVNTWIISLLFTVNMKDRGKRKEDDTVGGGI